MAGENGNSTDALTEPFDDHDLSSYAFFSFTTLMERLHPEAPGIGSTKAPQRELIRFRANPTMGFPPGEIFSVVPTANGKLDVFVNHLGLHGPSSPLPPWYTEQIVFSDGPSAFADFLDFFNHRLVSLLVAIWKHYRHEVVYQRGARDPVSTAVGALFGLMPGHEDDRYDERRVRLLPYAGLFGLQSRSAHVVAGILSHYLGVRCTIEEFISREIDIPVDAQWRLGGGVSSLGDGVVLGDTMPDVTGKFRVCLGPLTYEQFRSLLPDQEMHEVLRDLIGFAVRDPLAWDLSLQLEPGAAPQWTLGESEFGWTSMLEPAADATVEIVL